MQIFDHESVIKILGEMERIHIAELPPTPLNLKYLQTIRACRTAANTGNDYLAYGFADLAIPFYTTHRVEENRNLALELWYGFRRQHNELRRTMAAEYHPKELLPKKKAAAAERPTPSVK